MRSLGLFKILLSVFLFIIIACKCHSHDGHEVEDVLIDDLKDLGYVEFSNVCEDNIKNKINTGVALLHHMMYAQAEKHFKSLIKTQPDCAILYWGYSMTLFHPLWPDKITDDALSRGYQALTKAIKLPSSAREKAYINASMAYFKNWQTTSEKHRLKLWHLSQKNLAELYPNDIDAAAFYALSMLVIAPKNDASFQAEKISGKQLEAIYNLKPTHPGAIHYAIHAYDNPMLAIHGRKMANAYASISPAVPHALHMPSHIFVRLGDWKKAASWNLRSAKAALKLPSNNQTSLHYVHAGDYLVYSYMQTGDKLKALAFMNEIKLHHPIQPTFPAAFALTAIPARIALESKDWLMASKLEIRQPSYINWNKFPQIEAMTYFSRGIGAAKLEQISLAKENFEQLNQLHNKVLLESPDYWAVLVKSQTLMVGAWIQFAQGQHKSALHMARKSADLEDSVEKDPVTPGALLPARELLADMLVLSGQLESALIEYKAVLNISPNRKNSLTGVELTQSKLSFVLSKKHE